MVSREKRALLIDCDGCPSRAGQRCVSDNGKPTTAHMTRLVKSSKIDGK